MPPTRLSRVAVAAFALVATACGSPTKPAATSLSQLTTYQLYAMTGAPARGSTAIDFARGITRADGGLAFDLAFDIDSAGSVLLYPVRTLANPLAGTPKRVGMQPIGGAFDAVQSVPATGYDTLSVQTVKAGTVLAVELQEVTACQLSTGGLYVYAKLVVDSVATTTRRIFGRYVTDPNCGYHEVRPDTIPTF